MTPHSPFPWSYLESIGHIVDANGETVAMFADNHNDATLILSTVREEHPLIGPIGFFSVAVYLCSRAYGGPEEGGWWYDYGEPQLTEGFPIPILVATEEEIFDANQKLNKWIEAQGLNKDRRPREAEYRSVANEGMPAPFPKERPYYS